MHAPRRPRGFTLIELLIAVIVVSILAAIAIPSYQNYVLRGNRTLAKSILTEIAARQESFYADRKQYAVVLGPLGLGYVADEFYIGQSGNPTTSNAGAVYRITLPAATALSYTVRAEAYGNQQARDARCATLSLDHTGVRSATGGGGADCWNR